MAGNTELETLLAAISMKLANHLATTLDLGALMGREDAIGERLVRKMRRRAMLHDVSELVWRQHTRELLVEMLADAGIDADAIDIDVLEQTFRAFFVTAASLKLDQGSQILEQLEWKQSTGTPDTNTPTNTTGNINNYVLARSGEGVVYISGEGPNDFGISWRLDDDGDVPRWSAENRIPLTLPASPVQSFSGFYDPVRGGVACWTLLFGDLEASVASGVLVNGSGANPIEQSGDIPTGPFSCDFDFGVIFGRDPVREVTIALGRDAIWELDASNVWRRVREMPAGRAPKQRWFSRTSGSVFAPGHGVLFYWKDWDDSALCMLKWDGKSVLPVSTYSLPDDAYARDAGSFCEHPEYGAALLVSSGKHAGAVYAYEGGSWREVDKVGVAPPPMEFAATTCDGGRYVIGPGKRKSDGGRSVDEQSLHIVDGATLSRCGETRVGTGAATARRLLAQGIVASALHADGRLATRVETGWKARETLSADIMALISGEGVLFAIARDGTVHERRSADWTIRGGVCELFDDLTAVVFCHDPALDRIVAWGGRRGDESRDDTYEFLLTRGVWNTLPNAGSPLGKDRARFRKHDPSYDLGCHLVFDTALEQPLLFHGDDIAALQGERWATVSAPNFDGLVENDHRLVVHDSTTKETLVVCLTKDRVIRFDVAECVLLCDTRAPRSADFGRSSLARPWEADWVYELDSGRLSLYYDDELNGTLSLDLGAAFDHAAARGERTPLPVSQAYRLDAEGDIVAAITAAALQTAAALTDEQIEAALGLPLRMLTDGMIRERCVRVWRTHGLEAVRRACADSGVDLAARGFCQEDCREMFADVLAANLRRSS